MFSYITGWKSLSLLLIKNILKLAETQCVTFFKLPVTLREFLNSIIREMHELVIHIILIDLKG